jgi:hypothetical protein
MSTLRRNNIIFNAENIVSTLDIEINEDYNTSIEETFESMGATSTFKIDRHNDSRYCFMTENFENDYTLNLIASFDVLSIDNGDFHPSVNIKHPKFKEMMLLVNKYIKVFMIVFMKKEDVKYPLINVHMSVKYLRSEIGELLVSDISLLSVMITRSLDPVTKILIQENIENIVNNYLKKVGFTHIDKNTDFEELLSLVNMQKTVDDMELI